MYSVFLIGDAGEPGRLKVETVHAFLRKQLQAADINAAILFLGDNIYPFGLPEEGNIGRKAAETSLQNQFDIVQDFNGKVIFLPGNHDWNRSKKGGWEQVRRQEAYIETISGGRHIFIPDSGCPGPLVLPLQEKLVLVALDTEWWLHRHQKPQGETSNCNSRTKAELAHNITATLEKHKDKNIIVAAHHPLFSDGAHGGYFPAEAHLFPLLILNHKYYIPLPVFGTMYALYRKSIGSIQDIPHPRYREMKNAYLKAFLPFPGLVYASGHDHNLQYFERQKQHFIISGSGSKTEYLKRGAHANFSHLANGFSRINYYPDGSVWLEFWTAEIENGNPVGVLNFRKKIK